MRLQKGQTHKDVNPANMLTKVITIDKFKFYVKLIGIEVVLVSKLCASRFFVEILLLRVKLNQIFKVEKCEGMNSSFWT